MSRTTRHQAEGDYKLHWLQPTDDKKKISWYNAFIVDFHMTSLKFRLQNYRSYWDFTFLIIRTAENYILYKFRFKRVFAWCFDRERWNI